MTIEERATAYAERYSHDIEVITYKGHDYIVLSATKWCNGITHDPDCPYYKKGGSEHGED